MKPSSGQWYVDPSVLRPAIAAYPTLQAAVFPAPPTTLTPAQSQDITVYQLLQVSHNSAHTPSGIVSLYQTCSLTKITLLWVTFSQTVPLLLSGNICPPLHSSISLSCHLFLHPFVHPSISSIPSFPPSYREVCHSTSLVCSSGSQLMCSPLRMTPQKVGIILHSSLSLSLNLLTLFIFPPHFSHCTVLLPKPLPPLFLLPSQVPPTSPTSPLSPWQTSLHLQSTSPTSTSSSEGSPPSPSPTLSLPNSSDTQTQQRGKWYMYSPSKP